MSKLDSFSISGARGSKTARVARQVSEAIHMGKFAPGQRLVEADITEDLGISRSLLREVFRTLSAEGTIEIVPNRGAMVRRLSRREAGELFQIRSELEALAARLAARNCSNVAVRQSFAEETAAIHIDGPRGSSENYIFENQSFHAAVFSAAGNLELLKLNRRLQLSLLMAQISSLLTQDVIHASVMEHRAIAEAILAADEAKADACIRAHLARAHDFVMSANGDVFRRE